MKIFGYYILPEEEVDAIAKELKHVRKKLKHERHTVQRLQRDHKHMVEYIRDVKKILEEETKDEREGTEPGDGRGTDAPDIAPS